jgi:hypothetical protein
VVGVSGGWWLVRVCESFKNTEIVDKNYTTKSLSAADGSPLSGHDSIDSQTLSGEW